MLNLRLILKSGTLVLCSFAFMAHAQPPQGAGGPPPGGAPPAGMTAEGGPPAGSAGVPPANPRTYEISEFFATADQNKDGGITREELKAVGLTDRFFTFCDPDGSEAISKQELGECALPEAVDLNKDGALTVPEVVEYETTPAGKERGPGEPPAP